MTQHTPQTNPSPGHDKPLAADAINALPAESENKQKMAGQKKPDTNGNASEKSCDSTKGNCNTK